MSADVETISLEELKAKMDRKDGFTLVETLEPAAYESAHLPGALNVPPGRVRELAPRLLPDKDAEIVVYCASPT
jgi:rhodanese-related sulfurtransferase